MEWPALERPKAVWHRNHAPDAALDHIASEPRFWINADQKWPKSSLGDHKLPACAIRDIATTAARLLLDPSWTGHWHVAVLGPEDLSFNDMAWVMSEVLGKPVRYQQIPFEAYKARFTGFGMSEAMAQGMTDMAAAKDQGLDNAEPRTPENTTPTSFRQWCEEELKPVVIG